MKNRKPAWWQLWALIPLMFALGFLEYRWPLPGINEELVDTGIVLSSFALMLFWVYINSPLLENYDHIRVDSAVSAQLIQALSDPASGARQNASPPTLVLTMEQSGRIRRVVRRSTEDAPE